MKVSRSCTLVCMLALSLGYATGARPEEVTPTPKMLAEAKRFNKLQQFYSEEAKYEYHFRNVNGHILWCAYVSGGNGGFCTKVSAKNVAYSDHAAALYCQNPDISGSTPPHAVYGELWDLDYRCVGRHMTRLPVSMALDPEGYVRSHWRPLP